MSRKKFIIYLLIVLTLVMIVDIRYVRSDNHLFAGFITESIENMITMEGNIFQSNYDSDSIKAEKEDSLEFAQNFFVHLCLTHDVAIRRKKATGAVTLSACLGGRAIRRAGRSDPPESHRLGRDRDLRSIRSHRPMSSTGTSGPSRTKPGTRPR